jgi:hypothetical protein
MHLNKKENYNKIFEMSFVFNLESVSMARRFPRIVSINLDIF